jgi:precorrin-4 methylase
MTDSSRGMGRLVGAGPGDADLLCRRIKLSKEDRHKVISLHVADRESALDRDR